jgi:DNA mismatch repair protein MutS2
MQVYPSDYGVSLDFQQIVNFIKSKTTHERIIDLLEGIYPIDDFDEIKLRLLETEELANLLKQGGFPNFSFIDLTKPLQLLNKEGAVLLEEQVLSVRRSSVIVNELLDFFEQNPGYENLGRNFHMVYFTNTIVKEIDKIIDIHGLVKTSAFQSAVAKLKNQNMLRDFEETVYKSRRVLAVPAEYKRTVKGMILSHSANQLTAYIEPQGNLKLNLEIDELVEEERREIFKILRVLSHFLRQHL